MFFTVPFGLLLMCFALLFGLSAVGDDAETLGGGPNGSRRRWWRRSPTRRTRWGANSRRDGFEAQNSNAADYFGYEADELDFDLLDETYEETTRRLEEEAQLHMQQIMGDGT